MKRRQPATDTATLKSTCSLHGFAKDIMAEEPQPAAVQEGMEQPDAPATADDRATAKAMSSLDAKPDDNAEPKKELDMKAINDAMKNLETIGQQGEKKPAAEETSARKQAQEAMKRRQEEDARRKAVKVDQADVALLAEQLDMSKPKATDFLKSHEANAVKAMTTWVTSTV
ncbi:hypothetical protein D0869_14616 [Hortaea werneckii]|uniref:Nascent polypeptide-associated complex subunit alpha-like UBA domain-containing protein n=2 Tax=Hortaea werneckii TaxID=91943 RepID=A0A3M6W2K4_HORWE|nr:hypothetical protein D0869_14616 [Hortaea werneckii]